MRRTAGPRVGFSAEGPFNVERVRHHAGREPGLAIQRLGSRLHKFQEGLESPVGL